MSSKFLNRRQTRLSEFFFEIQVQDHLQTIFMEQ